MTVSILCSNNMVPHAKPNLIFDTIVIPATIKSKGGRWGEFAGKKWGFKSGGDCQVPGFRSVTGTVLHKT